MLRMNFKDQTIKMLTGSVTRSQYYFLLFAKQWQNKTCLIEHLIYHFIIINKTTQFVFVL